MPRKEIDQTSYPTEVSELTGFEDQAPAPEQSGFFGRLVRLVSGAPAEDHDKGRALRRAVRAQDLEQVRAMISSGVGVNEFQEASLACIAARRANLDMLKLLVEAGIDINRSDRRSQSSKARTPLQEAARKGWPEGVRLLLDLGAEVDTCESGDVTALHIAARMGHSDVTRLLLRHRADPCGDKNSATSPLHETTSPDIVRMLLQAGASVNQKDRNKCTPLHLQAYSGRPDNVSILLEEGADQHAVDRKGRPAVFLIGGRGETLKTYDVFKKSGINYNVRDLNENTLAHSLAHRAQTEAVLVHALADAPKLWLIKNLSGQTPFDVLNTRGKTDWAQRLKLIAQQSSFGSEHSALGSRFESVPKLDSNLDKSADKKIDLNDIEAAWASRDK